MKLFRKLYHRLSLVGSYREIEFFGQKVMVLTPTPGVEEMVEFGVKERSLLINILQELKTGDVFWDVGANIGMYTVFSARLLGDRGKVVTFEPESKIRRLLERNLKFNRFRNVLSLPYALGDEDGEALFYSAATSKNLGIHSLIFRTDNKLKAKGERIPVRKGDSLVQKDAVPPPTVIKIDVEGYELKVLKGMEEILRRPGVRLLHCEVHPKLLAMAGAEAAAVEPLIKSYGFATAYGKKKGSEFHVIGRKNP